jgi:hypothetical protein
MSITRYARYALHASALVLALAYLGWVRHDIQVSTPTNSAEAAAAAADPGGWITIVSVKQPATVPLPNAPQIGAITTNAAGYANGQIPRYAKFELTFPVTTIATNLHLPYAASPPPGVAPGIGVTVNALFSPDNWQTVYTQPAFHYQEFLDEIKDGQEWFYPTANYAWKVRFAPDQVGEWQYKIAAQDAGGYNETPPQSFTVSASDAKGFIRVSPTDARYFEFEDGTYFPGLGYNMNYDHVSWTNPVLDNQDNFRMMQENGIQLARIWLSQWAIYGSEWNPWSSLIPGLQDQYLPHTGIVGSQAAPGSDVSMRVTADQNCMFIGAWKARPAVKRNTEYRVRIRYKATGITGPRLPGHPFGFVAKTGGWLWGTNTYCYDPGVGTVVTPQAGQNMDAWSILEGSLNSGNSDFLPNFYLVLENVTAGSVFVDHVWIEEQVGDGETGPNIVSKPWMAHHLYMEQRNAYAFDKVLALAEQYGIYLRPVVHEKNERIFNRIDFAGNPIPFDPLCDDQDPNNNPALCPGNQWFYGNGRTLTKVRWLQQAWWRYLQARWGYSPNIHSWELLNEGDPFDGAHYVLADEFGKTMHQFTPNDHLVSTSTWHSFPSDAFWANPAYPNLDFADIHQYIGEADPLFADTAQATYALSMQIGAQQADGASKPVIRGETGFVVGDTTPPSDLLLDDHAGIWLHNLIWGGINPGGMLESYWYETYHIYRRTANGSYLFDHRHHFAPFANFVREIPLSNGHYQDAQAAPSDANLRVWGQKDLVNGRAHLWVQNHQHTWKNIVDGVPIAPVSATISMAGFLPNTSYTVERWDTYEADRSQQVVGIETLTSQPDGTLVLSIDNLTSDLALRVAPGGS